MKKYIITCTLLLAIPIIPFIYFGTSFEEQSAAWLCKQQSPDAVACAVITLLTIDVFLPIPSSIVCTISGAALGLFWGTIASTLGMTSGALLGFLLGRVLGNKIMKHFTTENETKQYNELIKRYGTATLILLRPVPLFAEASTLWLGCSSMSIIKFTAATLPIHVLLSLLYASFGQYLGITLGATLSVAVALAMSFLANRMLKTKE
ncbi:MAG: VTT domain-containing protein [Planctomycetaceae bacterium]|jgi:uncharacterized membrane protein YdjX (TVP38/TMEM64 family)|nr:VTT domain-containing protein [Planctomycetaceae bacterium]